MSEKMTTIHLAGLSQGAGFMDYGEKTAAEMIATYRRNAESDLAKAQAILAAADDDFQIKVVRGVHVQHHIRTIQEGKF